MLEAMLFTLFTVFALVLILTGASQISNQAEDEPCTKSYGNAHPFRK